MLLAQALKFLAIPFVLSTIWFGFKKYESSYYGSEDYTGNGTAH